jgi:LmbE family N-acetylglucosaminyl deacetylase
MAKKKETILLICAHPDDEIIGAGGAIAKWKKEGKRIITVICSLGEGWPFWVKKRYTITMRKKESINASSIVGANKVEFLGFSDLTMAKDLKTEEAQQQIADVIKKYRPDKLFTHSVDDHVFNHKQVAKIVLNVFDGLKEKKIKSVADTEVYMFTIWNPFHIRHRENIQLIVDISDTFEKKKEALRCFASQRFVLLWLYPSIYLKAISFGRRNNMRFAEIFVKIR